MHLVFLGKSMQTARFDYGTSYFRAGYGRSATEARFSQLPHAQWNGSNVEDRSYGGKDDDRLYDVHGEHRHAMHVEPGAIFVDTQHDPSGETVGAGPTHHFIVDHAETLAAHNPHLRGHRVFSQDESGSYHDSGLTLGGLASLRHAHQLVLPIASSSEHEPNPEGVPVGKWIRS